LPAKQIDGAALDVLRQYRWPGNIRELENLVRRLAALYPQDVITAPIVEDELRTAVTGLAPTGDQAEADEGLSVSIERHLVKYFKGLWR
jgi:two-component system nitrogen regulation response regulator GlnG